MESVIELLQILSLVTRCKIFFMSFLMQTLQYLLLKNCVRLEKKPAKILVQVLSVFYDCSDSLIISALLIKIYTTKHSYSFVVALVYFLLVLR